MSANFEFKNSAQKDKEVLPNQIDFGEIALNYHQSGPFLQCKDTSGRVWRIGGVIVDENAPASPAIGAWWHKPSNEHTFFFSGNNWIRVSQGSITDSDIALGANIAVSKLEPGAPGQLIQTHPSGTLVEWVSSLDVPGALTVNSDTVLNADTVIHGDLTVDGTVTTINTIDLSIKDKNIELGVVPTPTDAAADTGGITLKGTTDKTFNWINLTQSWTSSENLNLVFGKTYKINGVDVLSATSLGSGVTSSSLTSVGTIGTGVWQGSAISPLYGGTGQTSYTAGQLLIGKTNGTLGKATLTAGSNITITNGDGTIQISSTDTNTTYSAGSGLTLTGTVFSANIESGGGLAIASGALTLASSGVTAGTYNNSATAVRPFTVDAKGRLTGIGAAVTITPDWSSITSKPTTLSGYGITDAQPLDADLTAIAGLAGTSGFLKKTAANTWALDTNTYLTGNQSISITGDATGSGTTSITLTLANSGVTAGTYNNSATANTPLTVDAKGRITGVGAAVTITPAFSSITSKPTTLSGYGITDGVATAGDQSIAGNKTFTGVTTLAGSPVSSWSASNTDIDGLIGGSAFGSLFEGSLNGHFTIGLRSNDTGDGFQIISKEAGNATYTLKCFEVLANGNASVAGTLTAGTFSGSLTGNAATATTLATARTINGVSFNGSANITVTASTPQALTAGSFITSTGTFDGSTARTFAVDATSANTASKVVARDASGNFSAGTITASLTGTASGNLALTGGTLSGALLAAAGSLAAPGIATSGDTNTGLWWESADRLVVVAGGARAAYFDAANQFNYGNIFITTADDAAADATTTTRASGASYLRGKYWNGTASVSTDWNTIYVPTDTAGNGEWRLRNGGTNRLVVNNSGTVTATLFSGSGASLTSLNASNLGSGTIPDARISGSYSGFTSINGYGIGGSSGSWFTKIPVVGADGVLEVGRYIDFHSANTGGTDFDVRLECTGSNALTFSGATVTAGTFSGSGASLTSLNASNLGSGTVPDARLSGTYTGVSIDGNAGSATIAQRTVTGTNAADVVYGVMADNDFFRIRIGGTASDAGFVEIATADNGNEPIHVRQYTGSFATLTRTATLLDASGNTSFPGTVTGGTFSGSGASLTSLNASNLSSGTVPSARLIGSYGIDITGNSATVTNGVYTTGNQSIGGIKVFTGSSQAGGVNGPGVYNTSTWSGMSFVGSSTKMLGMHYGGGVNELRFGRYTKPANSSSTGSWESNPFSFNLDNGDSTFSGTVTATGLNVFDDQVDGTIATAVKLGRDSTQYTTFYGSSSGNRLLSVSTAGNPKDFQIRVTDTSATGAYIFARSGTLTATAFSGNGASLTSLNASNLGSGTVPDARLSGTYTGVSIDGSAGTLDGIDSTQFLRSDTFDQYDGQVAGRRIRFRMVDNQNAASGNGDLSPLEVYQNSNTTNSDAFMTFHISSRYATYFGLDRETMDLFVGGWSGGAVKQRIWHAGNTQSGNWANSGSINAVVGQLSWKNYGNNHTIFDASASLSPNGTAVNNTNSQVAWSATYPTLMGWNGTNTYGVRVDSARVVDNGVYTTGDQTIGGTKTFSSRITISSGWRNDNPGGGDVIADWSSNYLRYRFGGTATPQGITISNYDATTITLGRDGTANFSGDLVQILNGTMADGTFRRFFAAGSNTSGGTNRFAWIGAYKHAGITNPAGAIGLEQQDGGDSYIWADDVDNIRTSTTVTHIGTTNGTVIGTQTSDERLKNILGPVTYGLNEVKQLEPVRYAFKKDPNKNCIGFIAQQVLPIIPESVFDTKEILDGYPEDETKLGMEYVAIIPALVNAIKELSSEVDFLKSQLGLTS